MSILHHYIPAKRIADNVLGLYDIIDDNFLTNIGTGTLTGGSNASGHNLPSAYQELTFIESDGDCWIDTNYYPVYNTWFEIDCQLVSMHAGSNHFIGSYSQSSEGGLSTCFGLQTHTSSTNSWICWANTQQEFYSLTDVYSRNTVKCIASGEIAPWYNRVYLNNSLIKNTEYLTSIEHKTSARSMLIFATNHYGSTSGGIRFKSAGKLFELKIGEGFEEETLNLNYDGQWVKHLVYDGNSVDHLVYNGNNVF